MPTIWILPQPTKDVLEMFERTDWTIPPSGIDIDGQSKLLEPDIVLFDARSMPLDATFLIYSEAHIAPLLVLVADWDVASQVIEAGANDAVVMPCDQRELLFHVRRLLHQSKIVRVDDLTVDLIARRVRCGNRIITLSPIEFRLLSCLARRVGDAVAFDTILDEVWDCDPRGGTLEQVKGSIKRLRKKIERDSSHPDYVITVRGFGYRLRSQAQWEDNLKRSYE
jgi:two-component system response regulator MtrA